MQMEVIKIPYLKDLHLVHPVTDDDNFELTVLVGADYYWTFVQDQVIRGNAPTAVKSCLCYLISGLLLQPSATVNSTSQLWMIRTWTLSGKLSQVESPQALWIVMTTSEGLNAVQC